MAKEKFIEKLYNRLSNLKADVILDGFTDKSAYWIKISDGGINLEISFDSTGEIIEKVTVSEDIIQVVDEKKIAGFK